MPRAQKVDQLALDETVINDPALEEALEDRDKRRNSLAAVRAKYEEAHDVAVAGIARLELPEGGVARVGRFRITRSSIPPRSVAFETEGTSRIRISAVDDA